MASSRKQKSKRKSIASRSRRTNDTPQLSKSQLKSFNTSMKTIEKESKLIVDLAIKIENAKKRKVLQINKIFTMAKKNPEKLVLVMRTENSSRRIKPDIRNLAKVRLGIMNEDPNAPAGISTAFKCKCRNLNRRGCLCLWCNRQSSGGCNCTAICRIETSL